MRHLLGDIPGIAVTPLGHGLCRFFYNHTDFFGNHVFLKYGLHETAHGVMELALACDESAAERVAKRARARRSDGVTGQEYLFNKIGFIYVEMMAASGLDVNEIAVLTNESFCESEKVKSLRCVKQGVFREARAGRKFALLCVQWDSFYI